ncbi:MAG: LysR family transcriptional regulator [Polyangiaceae bacterium]|nr:LysR family transcriptional regulator [Polyangiaceae bacterium]MCB9605558.1 LysR family transcriptional regulator [Polyangiaceae bacterium]
MEREDLGDLYAFMLVAAEGSFSGAAAKAGTSQSSLSRTVRNLEARLGIRLLNRTTRHVAPTPAGERMLKTLRPALTQIDDELEAVRALGEEPSGTIRITTSRHAAETVLWPVLKGFLQRYPNIHVELSLDSRFSDIVTERFDAGVRLGEALEQDMVAVRVGPEMRLLVVGSPEYIAQHGAPKHPKDLAQHRCINLRFNRTGGLYPWELSKGTREIKVRVEGQLTCDDIHFIRHAAIDGAGLAFLMLNSVVEDIEQGRLVSVLDDWCPKFPGYYLYYPSRRQPSAAFKLLVEALQSRG